MAMGAASGASGQGLVDSKVLREALEMIEDMGEELSLSLDDEDDEDDEEVEGGLRLESSTRAPTLPSSVGPEVVVLPPDSQSSLPPDSQSSYGKRQRSAETRGARHAWDGAKRRRAGAHLEQALLALEGSDADDLETSGSEDEIEIIGEEWRAPAPVSPREADTVSMQSLDSKRSERASFAPPSWSNDNRTSYPMGPQLRALREGQGTNREYYTHEHLRRLRDHEAKVMWNRLSRGSKSYCSKVHRQPCKVCTTCHFCRQKTTDVKTWCPCSLKKGRIVGGKSRGILCGFCLEMRFGENLDEALANPDWRCPACRDICNCSGANCSRARRNLFPTNQLYHEANQMGYKSVAHYLILTLLTDGSAMPMPEVGRGQRPKPLAAAQEIDESDDPSSKTSKTILRQKTKIRLRKEIEMLRMEFPPPAGWELLDLQGLPPPAGEPSKPTSQNMEAKSHDQIDSQTIGGNRQDPVDLHDTDNSLVERPNRERNEMMSEDVGLSSIRRFLVRLRLGCVVRFFA